MHVPQAGSIDPLAAARNQLIKFQTQNLMPWGPQATLPLQQQSAQGFLGQYQVPAPGAPLGLLSQMRPQAQQARGGVNPIQSLVTGGRPY